MQPEEKPNNNPSRPPRPTGNSGVKPQGSGRGNGNGRGGNRGQGGGNRQNDGKQLGGNLTVSRGQAVRALKRTQMDAQRIANQYQAAAAGKPKRANVINDTPMVKFIGLGGMDGGGSKNMIVMEYQNDAIIMDCGNDLGVDLPGINYGIADTAYLEQIRHKIRAYVITHGHLDHIGGLPHIVPKFPAPIYGSKFTIGRVEEIFENFGLPMPDGFELKTITMNENTHERLKIGEFFVELVRITHSIPGSTCIVLDTPVGRFINTGDFRLDPNPLDHERSDIERLQALGDEGVLALLSESTTTERLGRTPSESTIEESFNDIMKNAPGRVFVGLFSTNMNRVQMIINAAVSHNKKVAMDGRSMVSTLEMAVRHGFVRIPKGTFVPIASAATIKDTDLVVVCTGSQGEPSSAMQRMSNGEHRHVKLKEQDTVVLSSSPIPYSGNDAKIRSMVDDLHKKGVHVRQHITREIDNHGPLHVSGHASIDEYKDMINFTKPKFFVPIYGDFTSKMRHIDIAIEEGIPRASTINIENGVVLGFTADTMEVLGEVPHGTTLVDQTGATVSNVVVKDRVLLAEEGLVSVVLTIDKKNGALLTSPDIISRGFIYMRENEEVMNGLRVELKRAVQQRFKRVDLDRFKAELKDHITHYLFEQTQRSPIVIPVVNIISGKPDGAKTVHQSKTKTAEEIASDQQKRFQEMRARLLGQDQQD
ncbi:MAG: putative hydrolase of the metallo-beta-lactamase superfamily [Candidatus Saccharibacteria bacterium]|nr:putative hydrolase of the metallo-beta-lactamase superfamily [Candidatus Saccharibacteria bacterium]